MNFLTALRLSVLIFLTYPAVGQLIMRGPYLQRVTPTSVVVRWRTNVPTSSQVRYGSKLENKATVLQPVIDHIVSLTGLQPATQYAYTVGTTTADLTPADGSFHLKTAPAFGSVEPVRLWVLGDFGTNLPRQKQAYDAFKTASKTRRPDLWIWLGDNAYVNGKDDEFQRNVFDYYPDHLRNLPFYAVPGNHDYHDDVNDFAVPYYDLTTHPRQGEAGGVPSGSSAYYSVDYGPVHLVMLDSFGNESGKHRLWDTTGTQVQWMKRDLAANLNAGTKRPWTIVVFHHPPYTQGSRNSDTEQDLILNRERLTPIFERYNVDLVLSGHSHIYERTYQLRGHRGLSTTFDKKLYAADTTNGRYDGSPNSCPISQKKGSVVYIVNGSGGANTGRAPNYPHKAMAYSYTDEGGSMLLDASENRLDAQWMAPSGVRDRFTMVKQVNRRQAITLPFGDSLTLKASWTGPVFPENGQPTSYQWSGASSANTATVRVGASGTYRVTDGQGCLADEFVVTAAARPRISVNALAATAYCPGETVQLTTSVENSTAANTWTYEVQLSEANGSFTNPRVIGAGQTSNLSARLPADLAPGNGYRLRVTSRERPEAEVIASPAFTISERPTASLSTSVSALVGQPASATVVLTGEAPWQLTFSNGTYLAVATSPATVNFGETPLGITRLKAVSNLCGTGFVNTTGQLVGLLPTATTANTTRLVIYPNPTGDHVWIDFKQAEKEPVSIRVLRENGRAVSERGLDVASPNRVSIPLEQPGIYLVYVQIGRDVFLKKILKQP